ncbi:MAG: DUF1801 domain-containing protein [Geobacteraceae bacterium]
MKIELLYEKLATPARRALQTLHLSEIEDLSKFEKEMISELHGIGPHAVKVIEREMSFVNAEFRKKDEPVQGGQEGEISFVDKYINGFPEHIQVKLQEIRNLISSAAPEASEKISYAIPTFYLHGNLVHFAGYKKHIGFYPGTAVITLFKEELKDYKIAKGSVQFPMEKPLPAQLIRQIVLYRVEENLKKSKMKK